MPLSIEEVGLLDGAREAEEFYGPMLAQTIQLCEGDGVVWLDCFVIVNADRVLHGIR